MPLPKIIVQGKAAPPASSWWATRLSRDEFHAKLAKELPRIQQSKIASEYQPSSDRALPEKKYPITPATFIRFGDAA